MWSSMVNSWPIRSDESDNQFGDVLLSDLIIWHRSTQFDQMKFCVMCCGLIWSSVMQLSDATIHGTISLVWFDLIWSSEIRWSDETLCDNNQFDQVWFWSDTYQMRVTILRCGLIWSSETNPINESDDQMKLCVTTISGIKCGFICLIICYIRCDNPQCGDQPDHPVSINWVWQQSVGCAVAESPAAARSDGGVNRAITQVIMTMVIMATIIIRSTEMNIIIGVMMQINNIKMANPNTNYSQRAKIWKKLKMRKI